ncbi:hypothetical protein CEXT_742931 [Caerostris extrusa]|uniref:Uncharacterized protein n=1 Tax=Caerostris extrusa TaxID=172846 RepID=A0AAV4VIW4_CAEEX|nr:hypothetical protein CEXT_742931 [Caerostris extrusa]
MRFKPLLWMLKTKPQAKTPDSVGIEFEYDSETAVILSLSITDVVQTTVIDAGGRTSRKRPKKRRYRIRYDRENSCHDEYD